MGSVIFIILRLSGLIDTRFDWVLLSFLLSLDSIGIPSLVALIRKK